MSRNFGLVCGAWAGSIKMHGQFPLPSTQHLSMQVTPAQRSLIHFNRIREISEGSKHKQVNTRMDKVEEKG